MAITFDTITDNRRDPDHGVEYNPTGIPAASGQEVTLFLGIQGSGSLETTEVEVNCGSDPFAQFGASPIADMISTYKRIDKSSVCVAIPMDEAAGTQATGAFPLVGTATAAGTLKVRIGDRRYSTPVASGATAAAQAALMVTEMGLDTASYMTAALNIASVDLTARQDGTHGNNVTIAVEEIPAGLTCTPTQPSGGATNPTIANMVAAMAASKRYHRIVTHFDIAADLLVIENEADDRWDGDRGLPCLIYVGTPGVLATLQSYGAARNSRTSIVMGTGTSPTPSWIWGAQVAAASAGGPSTPYTPRTGIKLPQCEAPPASGQFDKDDRNTLLNTGVSTFRADQSGNVTIDRLITTYQTDSSSNPSIAYLEEALMLELALYGDRLRSLSAEYNGFNVGQNGSGFDSGVKVVTPNQFGARIAGLYTQMIREGRAQNYDDFLASMTVEITGSNPYQLDSDTLPNFTVGLYRTRHRVSFSFGG